MPFRVELSARAYLDLDEITAFIQINGGQEPAEKWFNEIFSAIRSLQRLPHRCPLSDATEPLGKEIRVLLHGKGRRRYKVYFRILGGSKESGSVHVVHVRHWARRKMPLEELISLLNS